MIINYVSNLKKGKIALWCYLIWYLNTVYFYFDSEPAIWLNSIGISVVVGVALLLSVSAPAGSAVDHWQTFRLFVMPFAVSSFSSLIKGQGFLLIIPSQPEVLIVYVSTCFAFIGLVIVVKQFAPERGAP